MLDGLDLAAAHDTAGFQDDRGRRALIVAREDLALGNDEMDAGAFDAVDGLDGARQFAFQGAHAVDVLDKGGGAEGVRLVEDFIADAGGWQIVLRQRHAQFGHLVGGHQDGAVFLGVIFDVHAVELGGDGGGIARLQPAIEDGLGRLGDRAGDIEEECGENRRDARHDAKTRRAHRFEEFRHETSPPGRTRQGRAPCAFC